MRGTSPHSRNTAPCPCAVRCSVGRLNEGTGWGHRAPVNQQHACRGPAAARNQRHPVNAHANALLVCAGRNTGIVAKHIGTAVRSCPRTGIVGSSQRSLPQHTRRDRPHNPPPNPHRHRRAQPPCAKRQRTRPAQQTLRTTTPRHVRRLPHTAICPPPHPRAAAGNMPTVVPMASPNSSSTTTPRRRLPRG